MSVENLSQEETEKLLSTSTVSLAVQKPKSTTQTNALQALLQEVNSKINNDGDVYQQAYSHRKKLLTMDTSNEVYEQQRQKGLYSGWSSPSVEEPTSSPDSVTEALLNSSPSLQPFYDDRREKTTGTQTDSSEASIDGEILTSLTDNQSSLVNQELSRPIEHNSPQSQYSSQEKPLPPPRSCSFMTALMSTAMEPQNVTSQYYFTEGRQPLTTKGVYSSIVDEYPGESHVYTNQPVRGMRPQSAPTARQQVCII